MADQLKRRPNFTSAEDEVLTSEVEKRKSILFSITSTVTNDAIKEWLAIAEKLSKISTTRRTVEELRVRWKNIKSNTKVSLANMMTKSFMNKTGGGPPKEFLSSSEEIMLAIIGSEAVVGIEGGFDTPT
jgi:Myb/SANT-like DNA-binding domain